MQTELTLETPEQKYWRQVHSLKGNTVTNIQERARLVLIQFIKIEV